MFMGGLCSRRQRRSGVSLRIRRIPILLASRGAVVPVLGSGVSWNKPERCRGDYDRGGDGDESEEHSRSIL